MGIFNLSNLLSLIWMGLLSAVYVHLYRTYLNELKDIETHWQVTTATITDIKIQPITRARLWYELPNTYHNRVKYQTHLHLCYEYEVQQTRYRNHRLDPVGRDGETYAALNAERFAVLSEQETIEILYNPDDPSQSFMKQDLSLYRHLRWMVTAAYVVAMIGLVLEMFGVF